MKLLFRVSIAVLLIAVIGALWLWWNRPQRTDLSELAPADSIAYLESNNLVDVAEGIANTDAWGALRPYVGTVNDQTRRSWLRRFTAWTGIGPTSGVILTRAQLAAVVLDLGAREEGEVITIKPQVALLIETHTSSFRISATIEDALQKFAEQSYARPTFSRNTADGTEFMTWSAPTGQRQIVAVIDGSLVIVGNGERAVKTCLEVHRGQRPSLRSNAELQQMRSELSAKDALAFGFVSSANAAQLVSLGVPLLFGKSPGGVNFNQVISGSAPKILGSLGWSARPSDGGIEDRYLFSLQPTIASRLQPLFKEGDSNVASTTLVPEDLQSLTIYKFSDARATWQGIQTTLSAQLDTLSAILVTSLLKSALLPYGIENADEFLRLVGPELMTVRVKQTASRSLLIARVRDEAPLREMLTRASRPRPQNETETEAGGLQLSRTAFEFVGGYLLLGPDDAVERWAAQLRQGNQASSEALNRVTHFAPLNTTASVVTFSNDEERVRKFLLAIGRAQGKPAIQESEQLKRIIENLPYAATETALVSQGLDRRTKSALGQFSSLIPLLFPENK